MTDAFEANLVLHSGVPSLLLVGIAKNLELLVLVLITLQQTLVLKYNDDVGFCAMEEHLCKESVHSTLSFTCAHLYNLSRVARRTQVSHSSYSSLLVTDWEADISEHLTCHPCDLWNCLLISWDFGLNPIHAFIQP